ncbi:MAG: hypothetical protein SFU99_03485 [Saprospiraceae bacterium]|nr:hypothetical protein [Saprospiraceae bacterium]
MKAFITFIALLCLCSLISAPVYAVIGPTKHQESILKKDAKSERIEKRLDKFSKKLERKAQRLKDAPTDLWDEGNFRLGVLMLLAGLGLGLIAAIGILPGLIGLMAGLFAIAGLAFIIWSLVENA